MSREVAIVGYGYRLPGAIHSDSQFWELLQSRGFVQVPIAERYGAGFEPYGPYTGPGRFASGVEGLLRGDEALTFDSKLFGLSSQEAGNMDPQMRLLLTCAFEAFEHAGWDLRELRNSSTGVFIGAQVSAAANWRPVYGANEHTIPGCSLSMLANRISYHFNLMGPSASYLTACSSGITALHAALSSIQQGECEQVVVGASHYLGASAGSQGFNALGVISPSGACHVFDAQADGYMRAEGTFIFLCKRLDLAARDGDRILAVISATATNTAGAADGATGNTAGRTITAPTQHGQVAVMQKAYRHAGLPLHAVDYIEAHATGTQVGDRIEGNAIGEALGAPTGRSTPLRIGSVKSNMGHMEAASFTCSLLKVLLMIQNRTFAPVSRHFVAPNPEIDFHGLGLQVQTECEAFPARPTVFGINSFGFGGANGHCVVREYHPPTADGNSDTFSKPVNPAGGYLFPLSARTAAALRTSAEQLSRTLATWEPSLYDLAGNLSRRRTHHQARKGIVALDKPGLAIALQNFVNTDKTR